MRGGHDGLFVQFLEVADNDQRRMAGHRRQDCARIGDGRFQRAPAAGALDRSDRFRDTRLRILGRSGYLPCHLVLHAGTSTEGDQRRLVIQRRNGLVHPVGQVLLVLELPDVVAAH